MAHQSALIYVGSIAGTIGSITVPGTAYRMAFNRDRSLLYVTNFGNADVELFTYPAGKMTGTIHAPEWGKSA